MSESAEDRSPQPRRGSIGRSSVGVWSARTHTTETLPGKVEHTVTSGVESQALQAGDQDDLQSLLAHLTRQRRKLLEKQEADDKALAEKLRPPKPKQKPAAYSAQIAGPWRRPSAAPHELNPFGRLHPKALTPREAENAPRPHRCYEVPQVRFVDVTPHSRVLCEAKGHDCTNHLRQQEVPLGPPGRKIVAEMHNIHSARLRGEKAPAPVNWAQISASIYEPAKPPENKFPHEVHFTRRTWARPSRVGREISRYASLNEGLPLSAR